MFVYVVCKLNRHDTIGPGMERFSRFHAGTYCIMTITQKPNTNIRIGSYSIHQLS